MPFLLRLRRVSLAVSQCLSRSDDVREPVSRSVAESTLRHVCPGLPRSTLGIQVTVTVEKALPPP